MARNYYRLAARSQYEIARTSVIRLVDAEAQPPFGQWNDTTEYDLLIDQQENGGANLNSARVQWVRGNWGVIYPNDIGGRFEANYTQGEFPRRH